MCHEFEEQRLVHSAQPSSSARADYTKKGCRVSSVFAHIHVCRFIMGSNKMLQVALGKSESDELRTNLSEIGARLKGHSGLFFTKLPREEVCVCLSAFVCKSCY